MRTLSCFLLVALAAAVPAAQGACDYPAQEIKVPDGKTASKEEMAVARKAIETYMADMQKYQECIDAEQAALPAEQQTPEEKTLHVKRYNASVDAMQAVANQYNEQARAFKAAGH